ncbi:MAG: hypothetical protein WB627_01970, partial [Candidatus Acidiferrum sp.]
LMTRQLTSAVRHKLLRSPHAKRPPHGRLRSSRLVFTGGEVTIDRREWCERAGLGFGLGELGYKLEVPIRPALVA